MGRGRSKLAFKKPGGGGGGSGNQPMDANPGSPDTLKEALGKKGHPMSMDRAAQGANPFYDGSYGEYSKNCQRAVVATEARLRGYDVIAQPTYDGDTMPRRNEWTKSFKNAKIENVSGTTANKINKNVEALMDGYGNGARAVLAFGWKGGRGKGHVINVVRRNGRTYYVDGQTNGQYRASELFKTMRPRTVQLIRVDNLQFADNARFAVRQNPFKR